MLFKQQTDKIPIAALTGDPVEVGLVQSLAHPGGNITGVSVDTGPSLYGKRIELLREMRPGMSKLAFLTLRVAWEGIQGPPMRAAADAAGIALDVSLLELPTSEAAYCEAIAKSLREGANAVVVGDNADALVNHSLIVNLIGAVKVPALYPFWEFVYVGGLMAHSYDLMGLVKIIANDIDAVLRGANPGVFLTISLPNSNCRSTSRPPRRLDFPCRRRCSSGSTRSSNRDVVLRCMSFFMAHFGNGARAW